MPRPRKNITIDFTPIDSALNTGERIDLKRIAVQYNTCPPVIRRMLVEHYGDSITFKPGRNGGVQKNLAAAVSTGNVPVTA